MSRYYSLFKGSLSERSIKQDAGWGGAPVIYRAPLMQRTKMLQALANWRQGRNSAEAGYCSLAFQRAIHAAGVKGSRSSNMGHAKNMGASLESIGFRRVTDGSIRPGDAVIYLKGGWSKGKQYGHIGIATGSGKMSQVRQPRAQSVRAGDAGLRMKLSEQPLSGSMPEFDVAAIPTGLTPEDAWASTPSVSPMSENEIGQLRQMNEHFKIPGMDLVLQYLEE